MRNGRGQVITSNACTGIVYSTFHMDLKIWYRVLQTDLSVIWVKMKPLHYHCIREYGGGIHPPLLLNSHTPKPSNFGGLHRNIRFL